MATRQGFTTTAMYLAQLPSEQHLVLVKGLRYKWACSHVQNVQVMAIWASGHTSPK